MYDSTIRLAGVAAGFISILTTLMLSYLLSLDPDIVFYLLSSSVVNVIIGSLVYAYYADTKLTNEGDKNLSERMHDGDFTSTQIFLGCLLTLLLWPVPIFVHSILPRLRGDK